MPRRTVADAAETRSRILREARRLFTAQGYGASTAREIAAAAGVTVGALFHHFDSKAALFRAVFEQMVLELNEVATAEFLKTPSDDPLEAMVNSLRVAVSFAVEPAFYRTITIDGPVVLGADEWATIYSRMGQQNFAAGIEMLKAKGIIADQPAMPLAVLLLGAANNAGFALARKQADIDMDNLLVAFRSIMKGLAPATRS